MKIHTTYQGSRPCAFRQDFFMFFLYIKYKCKIYKIGPVVSDKYILKVFISKIYFSPCDLDMQMDWNHLKNY